MKENEMWMACRIWKRLSNYSRDHDEGFQRWETVIRAGDGLITWVWIEGSIQDGWMARAVMMDAKANIHEVKISSREDHITQTIQGPFWEALLKSGGF